MPAWITITDTDLMADRYSAWVTSVQAKAAAAGQSDPTPTMIANVTAEIRGMIGFRSPQLLDATTTTVPPNLKSLAVDKIGRMLKLWLNVTLTEGELADERIYQKRLEDLRDGKWPVDVPINAAPPTAQAGTGAELVRSARRQMTRERLRGL
jgi:hypothetical protein